MSRSSTHQHQKHVQIHNQGIQQILSDRQKQKQLQQNANHVEKQSSGFEDPAMTLWRWVFKKLSK